MQTRSRGSDNLIGYRDNINEIQRYLRKQRHQATTEQSEETMDDPQGNGQARARPVRHIRAGDAPYTHTQRQGIIPPPFQNNNFQIKLGMINLVQNKLFHGLPTEDPIDHLDEFDRLCNLTKVNGVSEDAIKLRLFPISLGAKAHQWEKNLPHGSITTWDDCKKAFLAKFFSTGRTAKLRSDISGFQQKNGETFSEAWERFKDFTSQCPHHGFSNESILSTMYRGVLPRYRQMLDTASNGDFLNQDVEDGWELVDNIARSDGTYNEEYDRTTRSSIESDDKLNKDVKSLNEKLDKLLLAQSSKQHVFVPKSQFVQSQQGGYQQKQLGAPHGFVPQQDQAPPVQEPDMMTMLQQLLQGQANEAMDLSKKFAEINTNLESLNSRLQTVEHQGQPSSSHQAGHLPEKSIQNPKEYAHAITLGSGKQLPPRGGNTTINEDFEDLEGEDSVEVETNTVPDSIESNSLKHSKIRLDEVTRSSEKVQPALLSNPTRSNPPSPTKPVETRRKETLFVPPPYKPPLPFPGRFKMQHKDSVNFVVSNGNPNHEPCPISSTVDFEVNEEGIPLGFTGQLGDPKHGKEIQNMGRSKPFSGAKSIISPSLLGDPSQLQELLSQVLSITLRADQIPSPTSKWKVKGQA